jgi:hypothetical protein
MAMLAHDDRRILISELYEMQLAAEGDLDEQNMSKFLNK